MKPLAQRLKAQIHIAKKDLALDDDTYRLMLREVTGKDSTAKMTERQLINVVNALKAKGWKPRANNEARRKVSPPSRHKKDHQKSMADKIRALWIEMGNEGFLEDPSERALGRFCHRMVGKHSPDWLNAYEATQVIESLKKWRQRREAANDH